MDKPFCTYKIIPSLENSYFIGANTENGFRLTPGGVFDEENFDRVFILKGGPGTGKSTFMKKIIKSVEDAGGAAKKYYCSSDPDSLDAVIISVNSKKYLICDGTAPHVTEMKYPGAVSKIVNLSPAWDDEKLSSQRDEIISISEKKSSCFTNAYKYLVSAYSVRRTLQSVTNRVCDTEKLKGAVSRFAEKFRKFKGEKHSVYTEAFSMKGAVAFNTVFKSADEIYYLSDSYGISELYLKLLSEELKKQGTGHIEILSPINSDLLSGIYIEDAGVLVTHNNYEGELPEGKKVNMKRFLNGTELEYRGKYRFASKCYNALLSGAAECLSEARRKHFELEDIYIAAMNFKKADRLYRETVSDIIPKN